MRGDELVRVHTGKTKRAQSDYDAEPIEAFDLQACWGNRRFGARASDAHGGEGLSSFLEVNDPVAVFDQINLMAKRRLISTRGARRRSIPRPSRWRLGRAEEP